MPLPADLAPSPHAVGKELDGETVLLNLETGLYFGLNDVGSLVWRLLGQGGQTPRSLSEAVCAEYAADQTEVARDVEALLQDLQENGLLAEQAAP